MERYSELLSSNVAPEIAEVATIQDDITDRTKAIEQLEREVQRLGAELRRVEEERDTLATERKTLRGLLTSFRLFPAEVLSEIFMAVYNDHGTGALSPSSQVVTLCTVSKLWRDVAISTPRLWCNLSLSFWNPYQPNVEKITRWLGRSGRLSRRLVLDDLFGSCCTTHATESDCDLVKDLGPVKLFTQGPSLHSLVLGNVTPECFEEVARHMKEVHTHTVRPWDTLESLTLGLVQRYSQEMPTVARLLLHLPSVRSFNLSGLWQREGQIQMLPTDNCVLRNLTALDIANLPISSILRVLALCPNLGRLSVYPDPSFASPSDADNRQPILLPKVKSLRLEYWTYRELIALPHLIHTPSLVDLDIQCRTDREIGGSDDDEDGLDNALEGETRPKAKRRVRFALSILSFVQQSRETVGRIRIGGLSISSRGLEQLLVHLPLVMDLTLDGIDMDTTIFRPASHPSSDCHLQFLPRLKSLRLVRMPYPFQFEDVCNFFALRVTHFPMFKALILEVNGRALESYDNMPANDLRNAVASLRRLGVDVYIFLDSR